MIETLPERTPLAGLILPQDIDWQFAEFRASLAGQSQIVWGEHCSECSYPSCYAHCAFYTPRADFHCRRFVDGIESLASDKQLNRIRFRKWGKLEGQGPAAVFPIDKVAALTRRDDAASWLIASFPAPLTLKRRAAFRWNRQKASARPSPSDRAPESFVVEHWAPGGGHHPFTLTFLPLASKALADAALFQARFVVSPSYGRLVVPVSEIAAQVDIQLPFLCQIEPVGEAEGVDVVFGVCDFVQSLAAPVAAGPAQSDHRSHGKPAKVVVWDLDETLWTGVLAEDGADGVRLRPEAAAAVRLLDERGVLQTIASKNNADEALKALRSFGLHEYFLHPQIHWGPKSGSVSAQAKAFDLGLDSFVFIDDQPFERAEVQSVHPEVRTLTHIDVAEMPDHAWFNLPSTPESRQRRRLYRQEAQRTDASQAAGEDYRAFLQSSQIILSIDPLSAADLERVYELSQRTNQLNFTGRKYSRDDVAGVLARRDAGARGFVLRCHDRFGDYGLIGFVVLNASEGLVSDLFLSCRIQRKKVEHALIAWLSRDVDAHGGGLLNVDYRPTGRNTAAQDLLTELAFEPPEGRSTLWARGTATPIKDATLVAVQARSPAMAG